MKDKTVEEERKNFYAFDLEVLFKSTLFCFSLIIRPIILWIKVCSFHLKSFKIFELFFYVIIILLTY